MSVYICMDVCYRGLGFREFCAIGPLTGHRGTWFTIQGLGLFRVIRLGGFDEDFQGVGIRNPCN